MNVDEYVQRMRSGVDQAVSLADSETQQLASRLVASLEPSVRLVLLEALADAANEIDQQLETAEVTMTLDRGEPMFVVEEHGITVEQLASYASEDDDEAEILDEELEDDADDELVRFSLRIPRWAKDKIDERADQEGVSTNAYLSELIVGHVARRRGRRDAGPGGPGGQSWPGGSGGGSGGPGGPGFRTGPGFGGAPGGPGFGPFGSGFLNTDMLGEIGRMFADTFGEGERDTRGPRRGGRGRGGRRPGGPRGRQDDGADSAASGDESSDDAADTTD